MPRGGGKGGTLLRAHSFKLRHELEALLFTDQFLRTRGTGGVQQDDPYDRHKERCLEFQFLRMKGFVPFIHDWSACGNRQMHKAKGTRSGPVATAADCAFIAYLRAWTKVTVRARY